VDPLYGDFPFLADALHLSFSAAVISKRQQENDFNNHKRYSGIIRKQSLPPMSAQGTMRPTQQL
jgi:hypothetical protein